MASTSGTPDAGNKSGDYYKLRLLPLRYKLRSFLLPKVQAETPILKKIQSLLRTNYWDVYFAWTANLASHTFYVIMLPLPFWFGFVEITRDLVWVLGFGIYISGCLKDYFCLPRPRSPPLHRITMSGYTAKEYGFPSSHSANATAVTLVLFHYYMKEVYGSISFTLHVAVCCCIFVYYFLLIFGRVYCGMHGFLDIVVGSILGVLCVLFRLLAVKYWDSFLLDGSRGYFAMPLLIVIAVALLIHFHAQPVDDCPCFDDSVAFIGVLMGLEITHYFFARWSYVNQVVDVSQGITTTVTVPYSYASLGLVKSILRVVVGVGLVVIWKAISKKVLLRVLPPIYSRIGFYIPRNYFRPVSESSDSFNTIYDDSMKRINDDEIADFPKFVKHFASKPVDKQGPESQVDVYELNKVGKHNYSCVALRPRYDVEIVARLIIYAGIPTMAVLGFAVVTKFLGLEYSVNERQLI